MAQKPLTKKQVQLAVDVVSACGGNVTAAAAKLNMPRGTLQNRLRAAEMANVVAAKAAELDTSKRWAELHMGAFKDSRRGLVSRYVITSAQNATPVEAAFFASLLAYCKLNNAELIVIPYRYQNPTSMWSKKAEDQDWWAKEVTPYLLDRRIELNKHLVVLGDIKMQPTAERPLSGFDTITGSKSAIIAHPKLELITVPTPHHKLPKILTTTGACTKRNYTDTKAGKKGSFHHTYGACVVEIIGEAFHLRQLNAVNDGSFMDLNFVYTANGRDKVDCIEALVMGDTHQEFVDPDVVEATFGKSGIVETLKPKLVVWHDLHDFYSRNHHHKDAVFINFAKHHAGIHNVLAALKKTFEFVDVQADRCKHKFVNVFVPSNHPDALNKWVQETDPRDDPENAIFWAETFVACCQGAKVGKTGVQTIDPFVYWAKKMMHGTVKFLARDESLQVCGVELGYHGDKGPNGSRGSIGGFTKIGVKSIIGHSHSPGIRDGVYQVGLNSYYGLEYASGPSSWLQTDCILYKNGKRTLINFIDGKWRA